MAMSGVMEKLVWLVLPKLVNSKNNVVKTRLPISLGLLEIILFEVNRLFHAQQYLRITYKVLFMLSYYGLFRVGELAAGPHQIKAKDIHVAAHKPILKIILHSSKTHGRYSLPQKVKITQEPTIKRKKHNFCPFQLMWEFLALHRGYYLDTEPLFILQGDIPIRMEMVQNILRTILNRLSLDSCLYDCHSCRIGRASDLYKANFSLTFICRVGRWLSNAVFKYLRSWGPSISSRLWLIYSKIYFILLSEPKACDTIWIIGDSFVATTYEKATCMPMVHQKYYIKDVYDTLAFFNTSQFDVNLLSRLRNILTTALNQNDKFPRLIIITLDNDLLRYINHRKFSILLETSSLLEWLVAEFHDLVDKYKNHLPSKCLSTNFPHFLWFGIPTHESFIDNDLRIKFNHGLECIIPKFKNMSLLLPKKG